jgi:hypothetical protein
MKKHYKILFALIILSTQLLTAQRTGKMLFTARLTGAKEVPAVNTIAKGLVTAVVEGNNVTINAVFDSLSGPVTGCHFHKGVATGTGGTFTNFLTSVRGNRLYIKTTLTNAQIGDMMEDSVYFNVHTSANGGGEIRGQMSFESDYLFNAIATGAQEVPAVATPATAVGSFVVSEVTGKIDYKIVANGLSGAITGAHLHYGEVGRSGAVAIALTVNGNTIVGTAPVTQAIFDSLRFRKLYLNIHTAANPNGEIRGQVFYEGAGIGFDGIIEGAQETPAVASAAKGAMYANIRSTLDTLDYTIQVTGLTPNAAHFHKAAAGTAGGVLVALTPASASLPNVYTGKVALTPAIIDALVKDSLYANFHTPANGGGEIRGQVTSVLRTALVANLCGGQEAPTPVVTTASGAAYGSVARDKADAYFEVVTNGLSGNATNAHIHKGAKGVSGPATLGLFAYVVGNSISVGFNTAASPTFMDSVVNGLTYLNFHTAANTGGEIRGQLAGELVQECLANSVFELNGEKFAVKIAPNPVSERLNVNFESNEQFTAQIVVSDITGRQISAKNVDILRGPNNLDVNMSNVNSGIYFVQMRQANRLLFTEKVVKN